MLKMADKALALVATLRWRDNAKQNRNTHPASSKDGECVLVHQSSLPA